MKKIILNNVQRLAVLTFLIVFIQASVIAQPVVVPHVPDGTVTIDGLKTDWDTVTSHTINYDDASGDFSTQLVTDSNYLYFFTEVITELTAPQAQTFFIGIGPAYMLQIKPFQASDGYLSDKNISNNNITIQLVPGTWDPWSGPDPTTDFHRVLANNPEEKWILEGRIKLSDIDISDRNSFDLFLHINTGPERKYWPCQGAGFVDTPVHSSLNFGKIRNPEITLSAPFVNFGKVILDNPQSKSFVISNNGVAESELRIESIATPDDPFSMVSVNKGTVNVPFPYDFSLSHGEEATVTVRYQPTSGTTIDDPHLDFLTFYNTDPDPSRRAMSFPVGGNARNFLDVAFILDQSGSMLSQDKWAQTKWATEIAVETMRIFKLPQDRVGTVGFGGPFSDPSSYKLKNLDYLRDSGSGSYTDFSDADRIYWTPIGFGIQEAHNLFDGADNRRNIGILMSDGLHNRPEETWGATTVEGLKLDTEVTNNTKNMEIHTIALGSDAGVSTALLDDIKNNYREDGEDDSPVPTYNITEKPHLLAEKFIGAIMDPFVVNQVAPDSDETPFDFPIEVDAHKVLAMIAWEEGTPLDIRIEEFRKDGMTPTGTIYNSSYKGTSANQPFTYVFIDTPPDENMVWKIRDENGNQLDPTLAYPIVLIDLNVNAVFYVNQEINGTGQDIVLKARLSEVGRPIINTSESPVEVTVQIAKPDEGFGTYVSTHTTENCRPVRPKLPPLDPKRELSRSRIPDQAEIPQGRLEASLNYQISTGDVDVAPPRFVKIDTLFNLCNKTHLYRSELPVMQLYDDGTHGDEVANDGIYTLRFNNTEYEGSYVFRFIARGTSPTGARFSRTRTISSYVRVDVDPSASNSGSRERQRVGNNITREFYVIPRDQFGGYLGPGYPEQIQFNNTAGSFVGPVIDYNNGIYSQLLEYNTNSDRPAVTPVVQNKPLKTIRAYKNFELVLPFAGIYTFDNNFGYDDGYSIGTRLGYRITNSLTIEAEGGVTFMNLAFDDSGNIIQAMANLRYDLNYLSIGRLVPYITGGAGYVLFRNFATDDESYAFQGGLGTTLNLSNSFGIRIDGRVFQIDDVMGINPMRNTQITGGLVFRF